ncbi:hypothetical protein NDU88_003517 [Pleurodeles waltl]|uniref:Uncharacterized protein n=1 Tax=Pleurodeles waltl TaxID=8319 RepID=A0AAV7VDI4_PLEWA|nr:hypothetical protein NDU88_003517 [Pleurodeles waltl]
MRVSRRTGECEEKNVVWGFEGSWSTGGREETPLARTDEEVKELEDCCVPDIVQDIQGITEDEWNKALDEDVVLSKVQTLLCEGWPHKKNLEESVRGFWEVKEELSVERNRVSPYKGSEKKGMSEAKWLMDDVTGNNMCSKGEVGVPIQHSNEAQADRGNGTPIQEGGTTGKMDNRGNGTLVREDDTTGVMDKFSRCGRRITRPGKLVDYVCN